MTSELLDEKAIFNAARQIGSPDARADYLRQVCGADSDLRERVQVLLHAYEEQASFLESPPPVGLSPTIDQPVSESHGTVIGTYKLLEPIGEGGMGMVWMAQQTEPVKRLVALKLIKPGMDSKQVIARFEAERQALALMDHPNIARVLDGGTTSAGRPYFVMDLVKGVPITKYCDEHHLTPRQRLELFLPVCQAVQHAHQKGIIHRDLKPSNVLVALYDGQPVPKVIDFGVAKATGQSLTDKTLVTGFGNIVGTLEYMSPEQAEINQLDIDTRSDIYSLGVLLYELLAGSPPFTRKELEKAGMLEMLRVIREQEPSKPSTKLSTAEGLPTLAANRGTDPAKLTKLIRGELDWIVMKALEKDRNRRYETANGFAIDVQRYLADEPVQACPPSAGYRFRKLIRRNRTALAFTALVVIVVLSLAAGIAWNVSDQVRRQSRLADQVNQLLCQAESHYAGNRLPEAMAEVQKSRGVLEVGGGNEDLQGRVRQWVTDLDTAISLERIRLEWNDHLDEAQQCADYARAFRDFGIDVETLTIENATTQIAQSRIKVDLVLALDDWVLRIRRLPQPQDPGREKRLREIARNVDADPWRLRVYQANLAKDVRTLRELAEATHPHKMRTRSLVLLGSSLESAGDMPAAVAFLRNAQRHHPGDFSINSSLAHCLSKLKAPPKEEIVGFWRAALALRPHSPVALNGLGNALARSGRIDEAIACYNKAIALDATYASAHCNLGIALRTYGKLDEAITSYGKAIELNPSRTAFHNNLGVALADQNRFEEAIACCRKAIELDPRNAIGFFNLGNALRGQKKLDEAIVCFRKAIELDPAYASAHNNLGGALINRGKLNEAIICFRQAIELDATHALAHTSLGFALMSQGKLDQAINCHRKAIELDPKLAKAHNNLGTAFFHQRKFDEAVACFRTAIDLDAKYAAAHSNLGSAMCNQGKLDAAVASCRKAIELDPKLAKAHGNLGQALHDQRKFEEAISSFRTAIELDPRIAGFHNDLGTALTGLGNLNQAILSFRKAIELEPRNALAHNNLGKALRKQGKLNDALASYLKAIESDPKFAEAHINLGTALWEQGKLDEVLTCFHRAIEIEPKHAVAHYNLGAVLREQGKLNDAVPSYRKAIESDPRLAKAYINLGRCLHDQKKLDEAIACFKKGIELDPQDASAQRDLGVALAELEVAHNPNDARAHFRLGATLHFGRKLDEAIACYRKSIELDPKYAPAHYRVGHALKELGKVDEAIACWRKSVELDPKTASVHNDLGMALSDAGRFEEALAAYRKAIELDPHMSGGHNNLAWLLSTCREPKLRDPAQAVKHAQRAVELDPMNAAFPSTLGAADYRAGNWNAALSAFEMSLKLRQGGDSTEWFFMAMTHWQLGDKAKARQCYDRGVQWMDRNQPRNEDLRRFRTEAARLLSINDGTNPK